ncbi:proline-rich protein HaeIII subfamily 1-like [Eublepharis macularius]|uniref:Proline-rich protein HaeIII subfamily 1-like n=1 Tax=Eublepharis macularius TaxID=481883 RepID=A0AA97L673_EUBMA|nr:proline-rich protein HaeIII subfamily 1-like [Eublepharis macularius]
MVLTVSNSVCSGATPSDSAAPTPSHAPAHGDTHLRPPESARRYAGRDAGRAAEPPSGQEGLSTPPAELTGAAADPPRPGTWRRAANGREWRRPSTRARPQPRQPGPAPAGRHGHGQGKERPPRKPGRGEMPAPAQSSNGAYNPQKAKGEGGRSRQKDGLPSTDPPGVSRADPPSPPPQGGAHTRDKVVENVGTDPAVKRPVPRLPAPPGWSRARSYLLRLPSGRPCREPPSGPTSENP